MSSIFFYLAKKRSLHSSYSSVVLGNLGEASNLVSCDRNPEQTRSPCLPPTKIAEFVPSIVIAVEQPSRTNKMLTTTTELCSANLGDQDPDVVQVDVAFLTYVEQCDKNANVRLDSITYVTVAELMSHEEARRKQKREIGKSAYKHFKWYIKVLKDELGAVEPGKKFKIVHWSISSRNLQAFLIKSEFFPAISIIIAPNREHWYATYPTSTGGRSKYGIRNRSSPDVDPPTYLKCKGDYCANNCGLCRSQPRNSSCLCALRKRSPIIPTITEEEDLV